MDSLTVIYQELKRLYLQEFSKEHQNDHPPKLSFTLTEEANVAVSYLNVMTANIRGFVGTKMIYVNDATKHSQAITILCNQDGEFAIIDSLDITHLRCALMAALAVDFAGMANPKSRVGLVGYGRINKKTEQALSSLFGISDFVISTRESRNLALLDTCNVIISATSNTSRDMLLNTDQLPSPKLFVTQDTGYLLDESFREKFPSYTDYPQQLALNTSDGFPFDTTAIHLLPLTELAPDKLPAAVYLEGIALADVVVGKYYAEGKFSKRLQVG